MIKRTLFFANHCYLSVKNNQLLVSYRDPERQVVVALEDVGFVVVEDCSITFSMKFIELCSQYNIAVVFCDSKHMPDAMVQPFSAHTTHSETLQAQIKSKAVLKKQLWKRTVEMKILNQSRLLKHLQRTEALKLLALSKSIKSGDAGNREAMAAKIYWRALFRIDGFKRDRYGDYPNNLLNYGYAILRAAVARALVGSGLYPAIGIHHHNRYNAFCLTDDVMEPYRPFVDKIVFEIVNENEELFELDIKTKRLLLSVLKQDTILEKVKSPLSVALTRTSASIMRSFINNQVEVKYPTLDF